MGTRSFILLIPLIVLASCAGDNAVKPNYSADLTKLLNCTEFSAEIPCAITSTYVNGMYRITYSAEYDLLNIRTIIISDQNTASDITYPGIGYFGNDAIALVADKGREITGYTTYDRLNFGYVSSATNLTFKIYFGYVDAGEQLKEFYYRLGVNND